MRLRGCEDQTLHPPKLPLCTLTLLQIRLQNVRHSPPICPTLLRPTPTNRLRALGQRHPCPPQRHPGSCNRWTTSSTPCSPPLLLPHRRRRYQNTQPYQKAPRSTGGTINHNNNLPATQSKHCHHQLGRLLSILHTEDNVCDISQCMVRKHCFYIVCD